jgi:hypothetical protein
MLKKNKSKRKGIYAEKKKQMKRKKKKEKRTRHQTKRYRTFISCPKNVK